MQQTLKAMTRKFAGSAKVWLAGYNHAVQSGDADGARKTLDRAIAALPPRKHIKVGLLSHFLQAGWIMPRHWNHSAEPGIFLAKRGQSIRTIVLGCCVNIL